MPGSTTKLNLSVPQKARLRNLEKRLQEAVRASEPTRAAEIAAEIQVLFGDDRRHHRLLRDKLWAFEAALDANDLDYAESGFDGTRQLAGPQTRLFLEATILLGVCKLRQKNVADAKRLIREVITKINNIPSDRTRQQFQKRVIERVEEECVLVELVGRNEGELVPQEIHEKAVLLIQKNNEDEIYSFIGNAIPSSGILLLKDVRDYSILLLPPPDRKLLPAAREAEMPRNIGKRVFAVLRRIAWKTFCKPDSELYKLWSKGDPKGVQRGLLRCRHSNDDETMAHWPSVVGVRRYGNGDEVLRTRVLRIGQAEMPHD